MLFHTYHAYVICFLDQKEIHAILSYYKLNVHLFGFSMYPWYQAYYGYIHGMLDTMDTGMFLLMFPG